MWYGPFALFLVGLFLTWVLCVFLLLWYRHLPLHDSQLSQYLFFNPFCEDEYHIVSFLAMIPQVIRICQVIGHCFIGYRVIAPPARGCFVTL